MIPRVKTEPIINFLAKRGLYFGASHYPGSGTHLYMFIGGRIRYETLGTAKAYVRDIKRKEKMGQWRNFGLTRA